MIVVPRILEDLLKPGTIVELNIDVLKEPDQELVEVGQEGRR